MPVGNTGIGEGEADHLGEVEGLLPGDGVEAAGAEEVLDEEGVGEGVLFRDEGHLGGGGGEV